MKVSNRIKSIAKNPQFLESSSDASLSAFHAHLEHLNCDVIIQYRTVQKNELMFEKIIYQTKLTGPYLGVLDALISMAQNIAVEAIDRISPKELDAYLRDNPKIPSIEYFGAEFYEILGIGESLREFIVPKKKDKRDVIFKASDNFSFYDLPFSEQIECFEEFLSRYLYSNPQFSNIEVELEDVNFDNSIIVNNSKAAQVLKDHFSSELQGELGVSVKL